MALPTDSSCWPVNINPFQGVAYEGCIVTVVNFFCQPGHSFLLSESHTSKLPLCLNLKPSHVVLCPHKLPGEAGRVLSRQRVGAAVGVGSQEAMALHYSYD